MDNQSVPKPPNAEQAAGPEVQVPTVAAPETAPAVQAQAGPSQPVTLARVDPTQVNPAAGPTNSVAAPAPSAAVPKPAIADDVDVIEKEWVNAAEEIVAATAGDPHKEEEQIEDLQIDYMKKRYGKDVKKS